MIITKLDDKKFVIKGIFKEDSPQDFIVAKKNKITEDVASKTAYIYLGEKSKYKIGCFKCAVAAIVKNANRSYQIDFASLLHADIDKGVAKREAIYIYNFNKADLYTLKTNVKKGDVVKHSFVNMDECDNTKKAIIISESIQKTRGWQIMPPNILRSTIFAEEVKADLSKFSNIKVTILTKKELKENKMGLILGVNAGSAFDARVVIAEYVGNPSSKDKTALVGKGIMFDSGGMNIKTGKFMLGMKYDMSGVAVVAGAMKSIAQLKPKQNVVAIMPMTDNAVSATATYPDAVLTSMNGKTVEINNTDAEGRLVLADGITWAVRKEKATRIVDIATLTGAMGVSLGKTYTGIWSTTEKGWEDVKAASEESGEPVWRMPLHEDFAKFIKGTKLADLRNTDYTGKGGSSSAAMFLTQFSEGVEHIHIDIAGTADIDGVAQGVMVKTLVELVSQ